MNNAAKNFDILTTSLSVLYNFYIILVQQNYFSDPAKILDLSAKPFFPCMNHCIARSLEGKSPSHRGCVHHIVASYLSPRALESGTLNDKHHLRFRRVLDSVAPYLTVHARIFFIAHTFHSRSCARIRRDER